MINSKYANGRNFMAKAGNRGFTLIELMLVIVVVGVLAAIAYPSFIEQIQKAKRSDAKQALFDVAAKLEQYYQDNKGYPSTVGGDDMTTLGYGANPFESIEGYYDISFVSSTGTAYTIQAVPARKQIKDKNCHLEPPPEPPCCGIYRLNQLGAKTVADATLSADRCW